jgi:hypothetical protein
VLVSLACCCCYCCDLTCHRPTSRRQARRTNCVYGDVYQGAHMTRPRVQCDNIIIIIHRCHDRRELRRYNNNSYCSWLVLLLLLLLLLLLVFPAAFSRRESVFVSVTAYTLYALTRLLQLVQRPIADPIISIYPVITAYTLYALTRLLQLVQKPIADPKITLIIPYNYGVYPIRVNAAASTNSKIHCCIERHFYCRQSVCSSCSH